MSENNRNIDELFRQELGNATEAPPSSVWEDLEQRLERESPSKENDRKSYLPYLLLLLFAALIVGYFIVRKRAEKNRAPVQKETGAATVGKTTDLNKSLQTDAVADRHQKQQEALTVAANTTTDHPGHGQGATATENTTDTGITRNKLTSSRTISEHSDAAQVHAFPERRASLNRKSKYSTAGKRRTTGGQNAGRKTSLQGEKNRPDAENRALSGTAPIQANTITTEQASNRNTGKVTTGKKSSAAQKQQTPSPGHNASIEREENKPQVKTNPKQEMLAANDKKTGRQVGPNSRDNKRMSNDLPGSPTQSTNTKHSGAKQTGSTITSLPGGSNTLPGKAGNEGGATETAQSIPSVKSGKETAAKNNTQRSDATTAPQQDKLANNRKPATLAEASGTVPTKATAITGKEAAAKNGTRVSGSSANPEQREVLRNGANDRKAATLTTGTEQAKAMAKPGKETVIKSGTPHSDSTVNSEQGKAAPSTAGTVQAKSIPKAGKETAAKNGVRISDSSTSPGQRRGLEKVRSSGESATLATDTKQPKAIAKTKKETEVKSSTRHDNSAAEQEKAPEKAANNKKTVTAAAPSGTPKTQTTSSVKAEKESVAKSSTYSKGSSAGRKQDKVLEQTLNKKKTEGKLPAASTAMQKTTLGSATGTKVTKEEKKPIVSKNEADEDSGNDESAEGTGGQSGGTSVPAAAKNRDRRPLNMAIGVKAAYEKGFQSYTANTVVASVFGEVNFSPKVSFIIQPGIKLANTSKEYRTANGTYIRAGAVSGTMYYEELDSMSFPTGYKNYAYSQAYDSIVAYRQAQKKFTEFELPFMVRYKMDKNLSFLAGMNFTFGKTLKMEGVLQTYSNLQLADTIFRHYDTAGITPPAPAVFTHPGSVPFSAYKDPAATELINLIRFGYTFGLSYTLRQRLIIDLTLQQNLSRLSDIDDEQIKKLFTQPYIRLSVGYSVFGRRK